MRDDPCLDTQAKISAASKVGQTTISRILKGTTAPTVDRLDAIARAFHKDVGDLFTTRPGSRIRYDVRTFQRISDHDRARIEAFIERVITENEPV